MALLLLLLGLLWGSFASAAPPELRVLQRIPLPAGHSAAMDLRWASDDSVYVARAVDGVFEVGLDGALRRAIVPGFKPTATLSCCDRLAVSESVVGVAARGWDFAWRRRVSEPDRTFVLHREALLLADDLDLQGDRVLLLGLPEKKPVFASEGAVAWIGTLTSGLAAWQPVLFDEGGAGAPHSYPCRGNGIGAVRFLPDGSFVIVPGFQKGVLLFAADGRRLRSWTSEEVGLDTECGAAEGQDKEAFLQKPELWHRWLDRHHAVDDILPLAEGPGLLVRSLTPDGEVHWQLTVLSGARVQSYRLPVVARHPTDRLHGDIRGGRIALLLSASGFAGDPREAPTEGEVILVEAPSAEGRAR
jgi:hypothetical protein